MVKQKRGERDKGCMVNWKTHTKIRHNTTQDKAKTRKALINKSKGKQACINDG